MMLGVILMKLMLLSKMYLLLFRFFFIVELLFLFVNFSRSIASWYPHRDKCGVVTVFLIGELL